MLARAEPPSLPKRTLTTTARSVHLSSWGDPPMLRVLSGNYRLSSFVPSIVHICIT